MTKTRQAPFFNTPQPSTFIIRSRKEHCWLT